MQTHDGNITSQYINKLQHTLNAINHDQINNAISLITTAIQKNKQIITLGNGGSAITSLHFITDWNKSIFLSTGQKVRGRSLIDNIGLLTAYANDVSYNDIFIEQLKNIMENGDLVIALSGSGNSENIIRAVEYANNNDAVTLGLCGYNGGKLKTLAQHIVWANINDMQISEDIHAIFGHIVMQTLCNYPNHE